MAVEKIQPKQPTGWMRMQQSLHHFAPKPLGASMGWDISYVLALVFVEFTVMPWFLPTLGYIDWVTPLVTVYAATQSYTRSLIIGITAGLTIEAHMTIPAGTFVCCYLVILNVLMIVRELISWRQVTAWLVVSMCTLLWVFMFELFVTWVTSGGAAITPLAAAAAILARLTLGVSMSLWLSARVAVSEITAED